MEKKEYLDFLKKDRSAGSETFLKKLREIGLNVSFGCYGYWDGEPYIKIGDRQIFLTETYSPERNSYSTRYRMQNDVIREIKDAIAEAKKDDQEVQDFFDSIEKGKSEV